MNTSYPMRLCSDGRLRPIPPQRTKEQSAAAFRACLVKQPDGCLVFKKPLGKVHGYRGQMRYDGKAWAPARLAYFLHHGSIPEGKEICHTCDEGRCCNVKHLFPGTHLDNMRDMIAKGRARHAAGQEHERAKLTNKDVREIRRRMARRKYGDGKRIAKDFGITHNHVLDIVARRAWKHLA